VSREALEYGVYIHVYKKKDRSEQFLFSGYCKRGFDQPAVIPKVYLHYDPYTRRAGATLLRQRMDFLMLLPARRRVVLEIDGIQQYASKDGRADTRRYAEMVSADRELQLAGYEVHHFGGQEFVDRDSAAAIPRCLLRRPQRAASSTFATADREP
jgi:very-short-patch-repair endonuclease